MIDHVSVGVSDFLRSVKFYEAVLAPLGLKKLIIRTGTVGFGKTYPEFWINLRDGMNPLPPGNGTHICLRANTPEDIAAFYNAALEAGGSDDGPPGPRPEYHSGYFAAFIIDPDGNRIEAVTFNKDNDNAPAS
jgi:catechol 2,3-dioxygenase-like lactoylglutathione lyase family enzyme